MKTLLGIDIGTSSIKGMLLDIESGEVHVAKCKYGVSIPQENHAEQDPRIWWNGLVHVLGQLRNDPASEQAFRSIAGIGYSGQMHGMVCLGTDGEPVRPSIIWLDQRSGRQMDEIHATLTEDEIGSVLHNPICSGFLFPSLLWMKECEPDNYRATGTVFQPKDYIRYRMTGSIGTDVTDASATGLYSIERRDWAWTFIDRFRLDRSLFPESHESTEIAGYVSRECAEQTGLREGIPVIYGCGDQMAQSIGNGVYGEGRLISNIGTGGQVSAYAKSFIADSRMRTNTFCHAVGGGYSVFGATLNSGGSLNWLTGKVLSLGDNGFGECNELAAQIFPGSDGLIYLPYLSGERTPILNPNAKGVYFGLQLRHDRRHFIRATMEGIIYGLKDCLMVLQHLGMDSDEIIASGGGAGSELFLQLQADIFEKRIRVCNVKEQACLGACILAGNGLDLFGLEDASHRFVSFSDKEHSPDPANLDVYRQCFEKFHAVYEHTRQLMH